MTVVDQPYDDHDDDDDDDGNDDDGNDDDDDDDDDENDDDDGNDDTVDILRKSPYDGCRPTIWKGRVDCATVDVISKIFDKIKIWF